MAELEDWSCEFNGLVMGDPDSAVSIVAVDGLLSLPDVRSSDLALVQKHGLYPGDDYMNGRAVLLTLEVYGSTREEFTEALSAVQAAFRAGHPETPLRFRFHGVGGDLTAFVNARTRKRSAPLDLNFAHRVCNFVIELYSTKPYVYGDALSTASLPSPWSGSTPTLLLNQIGSEPALPVITLDNASNSVLTNETTGEHFGLSYAGNATIDAAARTVVSSTGTPLNNLITGGSVWPQYEFGKHRLTLSSGATTRATVADFTWRNRWT